MSQAALSNGQSARRLIGRIAPMDFVGRGAELAAIARHGRRETPDRALLLISEPGAGASELLRQSFDNAFHAREEMVPVYFRLDEFDRTPAAAAERFLRIFLHQFTAFRLGDPGLLAASPAIHDFVELAQPGDVVWIEALVQAYERERAGGNEDALVRICLSAPLRAAQRGVLPWVMVDDLHHADLLPDSGALVAALYAALSRANVPFILAGRRRRVVKLIETARDEIITGPSLKLDRLSQEAAAELVERLVRNGPVAINDETRDLMAQQLDGSPKQITAVIHAAHEMSRPLDSFRSFQSLYVDELMGGRLGRINTARLDEVSIALPRTSSLGLVEILFEGLGTSAKSTTETWRRRLQLDADELARITQILAGSEFLDLDGAAIEVSRNSTVRADYLRLRHRIELQQLPRALVLADAIVDALKRAPLAMAREYRRGAALGIRETLARFDGQEVPTALFDYAIFRRELKGRAPERIRDFLAASVAVRRLPQIIQASYGGAVFPALRAVTDDERCTVARGFQGAEYDDAGEIVWLVAEIDAKVEAGRGIAEIWCDRLDNVARACGFKRWLIWLIAPEGFSGEAVELLQQRVALGSNFEQFRILRATLEENGAGHTSLVKRELVIPMSEDAELSAAEAVEEIARENDFAPETINQIKTAIIEACINATEHSLSPDRKIRLEVRLEGERLVVIVSSRGIQRVPDLVGLAAPAGHERGMGLGLIRSLMDEVEFERVDDGTRLRMVKLRNSPAVH